MLSTARLAVPCNLDAIALSQQIERDLRGFVAHQQLNSSLQLPIGRIHQGLQASKGILRLRVSPQQKKASKGMQPTAFHIRFGKVRCTETSSQLSIVLSIPSDPNLPSIRMKMQTAHFSYISDSFCVHRVEIFTQLCQPAHQINCSHGGKLRKTRSGLSILLTSLCFDCV